MAINDVAGGGCIICMKYFSWISGS